MEAIDERDRKRIAAIFSLIGLFVALIGLYFVMRQNWHVATSILAIGFTIKSVECLVRG